MSENKVLAKVLGQEITEQDVENMLAQMGQRAAQYDNPKGRETVLNQIINQKLLLSDAISNMYERDKEFKEELAKIKEELLVNYAVKKAVAHVKVTDEETRAYFDEHPELFRGQTKMNADHILVADDSLAKQILADIKDGKTTFEEAAAAYSTCPSKANGGNLGDFTTGQMVPEFERACMEMEIGTLCDVPVHTQFGWHLIRLNSRETGEPMQYADIADQLKEQILSMKQQQAFQSKLNQLMILHPVEKF